MHESDRPRRPRSHELETESRNFVRSILPQSWLVEDVVADYGTDLRVEIVEGEKPTGLQFLIQVKSHETARRSGDLMLESVEVGHLLYYQRLVLPVVLVVYDASLRQASYIGLTSYIAKRLSVEDPGWESRHWLEIEVPTTNNLVAGSSAIASEVRAFFRQHGLLVDGGPPPSLRKTLAPVVREMAQRYPGRSSLTNLYRNARRELGLKKPGRGTIRRIKEAIGEIARIVDSDGRMILGMAEPSPGRLFLAASLVDDSNLVAFLDSPWAMAVRDLDACAFILAFRTKQSPALLTKLNTHRFRYRDLYFALLEELLVVDPGIPARLRGVLVDSIIHARGGQEVARSDALRFADPSASEAYAEYMSRKGLQEWSELVVVESYHGIVRVRGSAAPPAGVVSIKTFDRAIGKGKYSLSVTESRSPREAEVVGVSIVRKTQPGASGMLTVYSTATTLAFRGDLFESLTIVAGQKVQVSSLEGGSGAGFRLTIDGIPVMDTWLGVDFGKVDFPPEIRDSIEAAKRRGKDPMIVFSRALSVQGSQESEGAEEILKAARSRHGPPHANPSPGA